MTLNQLWCIYSQSSWRWACRCPKHVEGLSQPSKIVVQELEPKLIWWHIFEILQYNNHSSNICWSIVQELQTTTTVATSNKHSISHYKMWCTLLLIKHTNLGETIIPIYVQMYSISPQEDCVWPDTVLRFPLKFWVSLNTRHYGDTKSFIMYCTLSQQREHIKKAIYLLVPALQRCDLLNQLWIVHIKY